MNSINEIFSKQHDNKDGESQGIDLNEELDSAQSSLVFEQNNIFIKFDIEESTYVCMIEEVKEVLEHRDITPLPISYPMYSGIINLRGTILPIFNIGKNHDGADRIIVFENDDNSLFGIISAHVKRVFIPLEDQSISELTHGEIITHENIPVKYFDAKFIFKDMG